MTLPTSGPLPRPRSLDEARAVLASEAFDAPEVDDVEFVTDEFTSVCPKTGQPDYSTIAISYTPDGRCLESKALKFYLWAWRDEGAFCEALAATIADDIMDAILPLIVTVRVAQKPRGGLGLVARATRISPAARGGAQS